MMAKQLRSKRNIPPKMVILSRKPEREGNNSVQTNYESHSSSSQTHIAQGLPPQNNSTHFNFSQETNSTSQQSSQQIEKETDHVCSTINVNQLHETSGIRKLASQLQTSAVSTAFRPVRSAFWKGPSGTSPVGQFPVTPSSAAQVQFTQQGQSIGNGETSNLQANNVNPQLAPVQNNIRVQNPQGHNINRLVLPVYPTRRSVNGSAQESHQQMNSFPGGYYLVQSSSSSSCDLSASSTSLGRSSSRSNISISSGWINPVLLRSVGDVREPDTLEEAVCQYIDYLILENEEITHISQVAPIRPVTNINFFNDAFYREILQAEAKFPTPKFEAFLSTLKSLLTQQVSTSSRVQEHQHGYMSPRNNNSLHVANRVMTPSPMTTDLGTTIRNACSVTSL